MLLQENFTPCAGMRRGEGSRRCALALEMRQESRSKWRPDAGGGGGKAPTALKSDRNQGAKGGAVMGRFSGGRERGVIRDAKMPFVF